MPLTRLVTWDPVLPTLSSPFLVNATQIGGIPGFQLLGQLLVVFWGPCFGKSSSYPVWEAFKGIMLKILAINNEEPLSYKSSQRDASA
jgi:hypothetical protein